MFGLFKKKILKTEEEKRAESLPRTKKVQFEPMKVAEAEQLLDADIRAVLGFSPVNYYATKDRYLLCTFWYTDDLPHGHTKMYQIDKVLMRDILRKFGQNINIGE